jgi:hypothetical protein
MKILLSLIVLFAVLLLNTSSVSAYGGGATPPTYDNPHSPVIIECKIEKQKLPFNRHISIPKCKIVKNPEFKAYEKDFQQRLKDFVKRVRKGGK